MQFNAKLIANLFLRLVLPLLCIIWVVQGIEAENLVASLAAYSIVTLAICGVIFFLSFLAESLRLRFLTQGRAGIGAAFEAHVIGMGMNVMLPAKLGEAARVLHLSGKTGIPAGRITALIFWERFMDLNFLLLFGALAAHFAQYAFATLLMSALVGLIWTATVFIRVFPGFVHACLRHVPGQRIRLFLSEAVMQLRESMKPAFLLLLCWYGVLVWLAYVLAVGLAAQWGLGMGLTTPQVLLLFLAAAGSLAVPSAPGSVGVFEAAVVAVLASFGWDRTEALAAAIALHLVLSLPQMIGAIALIIAGRFRIATLTGRTL